MRWRPFTRFFCLLLAMVLMLSSVGCGTKKDLRRRDEGEQKTWQGVITLWDFPRWEDENGNRYGWIERKIAEFEKSHPGVFIHLRKLKWEYGMLELRAAASTGTNPDIAPVAGDIDFILQGYLEPVDEFFTPEELKRYDERVLKALSHNGRLYGFPWFITTYGLFLNADAFRSRNARIPTDGEWSYQEFVEALQKLTYDKNRDRKHDYFGFNSFLYPGSYQMWGFLTMDGARLFDENGRFVLNSPEGKSALTKIVDLSAKYRVVPEDFGTGDEKQVWSDFIETKKIAVCPAGPWAIKILEEKQRQGKGFEFEIARYPSGSSKAKSIAFASGYAIFKQQDPGKRAMCAEFLKFITSEREQEELMKYGVFPAIKDLQEKASEDRHMKRMKEILDDAEFLPKIRNFTKVDEIITTQVRQAILGRKTPAQALDDAAEEIGKLQEGSMQNSNKIGDSNKEPAIIGPYGVGE
ncbi:ABC transporter substrate-binding protein [Thermosediminibacter oceani]|uniref:Extracellular solute-binding protein family 1 n=1 Tax=Thermosediminibacter oceani (strain ATCC BAA-1034 / DSM 16646 / JW/IW-1228P) TaxID=555079 RepID=D9S2I4_THEOJ|nr:sugar ABC transporter substrate-binding protein [Thermosediminibacter oceani]ADL07611.1 extracellular solute-binding protein family 1 [Thermosediminibacter oceani DSM 16646]